MYLAGGNALAFHTTPGHLSPGQYRDSCYDTLILMNALKPNRLSLAILVVIILIVCVPLLSGYVFHLSTHSILLAPFVIIALVILIGPAFLLSLFGLDLLKGDLIPGPTPLGYVLTLVVYYIIAALIALLIKDEDKGRVGKTILIIAIGYSFLYVVLAYFLQPHYQIHT